MLRGSTPIQLSQLDISPAIQAGALEQQAAVNLASSVNQAVQDFQSKQQEKEMTKMRAQTIEQFLPNLGIAAGTAEAKQVANVLAKDPQALKSMSDLITIGGQRQKQEILTSEFEASKADEEALQKAISVNITPEGTIDKSGLESSYLQLGGTNLKVLDLFKEPGEVKVDPETGIITQDGVFKGQVNAELLDIELTESEKAKDRAELDKLQAEIDRLNAQAELYRSKAGDTVTAFDPEKLEGIDKDAYDYAIANPGTTESEEILKRLRAK